MIFFKNKRGEVAPFPTLSFPLFFSFFINLQTTYLLSILLSIYLFISHLYVWCSLHLQIQHVLRSFLCLCLLIRLVALCGFLFASTAFLCLFLFLHQPTPPPLFHDTESVATPFLNFFYFSIFKIFLLKKCGMIYLHLECVYVGMKCLHIRCCLCVVG